MPWLFLLLGVVIGYEVVKANADKMQGAPGGTPPSTPPPQPAGAAAPGGWATPLSDYEVQFQAALKDAGGTQNLPYRAIFIQSHLETGGGTAKALKVYHNGFGFHADGPGNKFWDGVSKYQTTEGEILRVYKSLDLSINDYLRLIQARYPMCVLAAHTGDLKGYFRGLVQGGYATDLTYYDELVARYKAIYGTDA